MTINTRGQAIAEANATTRNSVGMCQKVTRLWYDAPSAGDRDHDGDADAVDGWLSEPKDRRHTDRNPPPGYPIAFSGGSRGHGHRAMTNGVASIRSIDMLNNRYKAGYTSNVVGRTMSEAIGIIERSMGIKYLGWSETIDGYDIPGDEKPTKKPASKPAPAPAKKPTPLKVPTLKPHVLSRFRVATNNLQALPHNDNVQNALDTTRNVDIIGFQEAYPPDFKARIKKMYPRIIGLGPAKDNTFCAPIRANELMFAHSAKGNDKLYSGSAHISLTRRLIWAVLTDRRTKQKIGVVNLHAVVYKNDKYKAKRASMRVESKTAVKKRVDWMLAQGLPVVITGDFNDRANWFGTTYKGHRVTRTVHGIDQIVFIDSDKGRWGQSGKNVKNTSSDHHALWVTGTLYKK